MKRQTKRDPNILDIEALAARLGITVDAAYALCQRSDFPATKMGREWRIYWPAVCRWMMERRQPQGRLLFDVTELREAVGR